MACNDASISSSHSPPSKAIWDDQWSKALELVASVYCEEDDRVPRKIRELRADLRRAGCFLDHQTGSHEVWKHPNKRGLRVTLAGRDGADAKPYQEHQVREALDQLRVPGQDGQQ